MAKSKIAGINIKIGADSTGLDTALSNIEKNSKSARSELRDINSTIKQCGDSAVLWQQKQKALKTLFDESKEKLELLESADVQLKKQLDNKEITAEQYNAFQRELIKAREKTEELGKQLDDARSHVVKFRDEMDGTEDILQQFRERTDETTDELDELGDEAENTSGSFNTFNAVLANLITDGIKHVISGLSDLTKSAIETGIAYETSMANIQALTQNNAENMDKLSESAKKMGN